MSSESVDGVPDFMRPVIADEPEVDAEAEAEAVADEAADD